MEELKTVFVSGNSVPGDYNCDGVDDHVQINQAFKFVAEHPEYNRVFLKGPARYVINDSLLIRSNTIFEGDDTAVLTIKDKNTWASQKPLIKQYLAKESTKGTIIIRNFEIDGNADGNNADGSRRGDGLHNLMLIYYDDVEVYNMYLHNSLGDGIKVKYSNSVKFYDNDVFDLGHDVVYADECQGVDFHDNVVKTMTNSAIRFYNSNGKAYNNEIYTIFGPDAGGPGIQIQYIREDNDPDPMNSIEIYNNEIHDTYGPGIWVVAFGAPYDKSEACGIHIHDNVFRGCGSHPTYNWLGGIVLSGFYDTLIENNIFDGNFGGAIVSMYPNDSRFSGMKPTGTLTPYITIVKNNLIFNTRLRKGTCGGVAGADPSKTGQGEINYCQNTTKIISEGNYIWNNIGGNYYNVSSTTDIYHEPEPEPEPTEPITVLCSVCQGYNWTLLKYENIITIECALCGTEYIIP